MAKYTYKEMEVLQKEILSEKKLTCTNCKKVYKLENISKCPSCNGILKMDYEYDKLNGEKVFNNHSNGIWKYKDILPIENKDNIVTLGEGNTPLIKVNTINKVFGIDNMYLKLESANPSGSFKDRGVSVMVSKAKELNVDTIIIASSGNAAAATAAYSARAGLKCVVCIPKTTPISKISQAICHGAQAVCLEGPFTNCYNIAKEASEEYGWLNATTTFINPYNLEGNKTIAYELWEQMNKNVPDNIVIPVGAGPILVGMYLGFLELKSFGLISKMPRLIGVQTESCAPITEAYEMQLSKVNGWNKKFKTIATAISDPLIGYEDDGTITLEAVRDTSGCMISLSEKEILNAHSNLATREGVFAEPSSAVSVGAIQKLIDENKIIKDETTVCIITGHGLKQNTLSNCMPETISTLEELKNVIQKGE